MNTTSKNRTFTLVKLALFTALIVVFQLISNAFPTAIPFSLALIPAILGALLMGPYVGLYLGGILGLINFIASFQNPVLLILFNSSPVLYILTCFGKTMVAGYLCGLVYKKSNKSTLSLVFSSILMPIVNTGIFCIMMFLFFKDALMSEAINPEGTNLIYLVLVGFVGINFFIEVGVDAILCPTFHKVIHLLQDKTQKHTNNN